jgi:AraC family transcriptional regulator
MRQVLGHSIDKYVTGRMFETSSARRWSNLLVERWSHAQGELPSLTPRDTEVAVLLRGRTLVDRIGSGMRQVTHGRPGTVWLCPSGIKEEFINVAQPIEDCLQLCATRISVSAMWR